MKKRSPPPTTVRKTVRFRDERLVEALSPPYTNHSWSSSDTTSSHERIPLVGGGNSEIDDLDEQISRLEILQSDVSIKERQKKEQQALKEQQKKERETRIADERARKHRKYVEQNKQKKAKEDRITIEDTDAPSTKEARAAEEALWQELYDKLKAKHAIPAEVPAEEVLIEELDLIAEEDKKLLAPVKIITPISEEWEEKVVIAMAKKPATSKVAGERSDLTAKSLSTLNNRTWLNDDVINEYIRHVVERTLKHRDWSSTTSPPPFATLNSNWWNTIHGKNYSVEDGLKKVTRWARRAKIGGAKLLEVEKLYIPINSNSHWMLLTISGTERKIEFLNSLEGCGPTAERVFNVVWKYLALELGTAFNKEEWSSVFGRSAQQNNGYDCGVFVCYNTVATALMREPGEAFGPQDMVTGRQQIAATLLNHGFSGEFELFK